MFLDRHQRLHEYLERLGDGLTEAEIREPVEPGVNTLAWLLWHVARTEDGAINLLICEAPQVLDEAWLGRLNLDREDAGTGMSIAEVVDLSARIDLASLAAYARAVRERTRILVASLRPPQLDEVVSGDRIREALERMVVGPAVQKLREHWSGATKGYFLAFLPLAHNYEHIGQADLIRGLLGHPGRF